MVWFYYYDCYFFLRFYLFNLREEREGEREGEKLQCVVASCAPRTRDLAHNPGMCHDRESNLRPFGLQAGAQSTEPHQPGLMLVFKTTYYCIIDLVISKQFEHNTNFMIA